MFSIRTLFLGTVAALFVATAPVGAQEFKVIVNAANAATDIPSAVLGKIFLKERTSFPDGTPATPVDQLAGKPIRVSFSKQVVGRPVAAVETYWQQQIFSGKEVPPIRKGSDDEVIAFVKSTPGAVGYVSPGASTAGVKVIELK